MTHCVDCGKLVDEVGEEYCNNCLESYEDEMIDELDARETSEWCIDCCGHLRTKAQLELHVSEHNPCLKPWEVVVINTWEDEIEIGDLHAPGDRFYGPGAGEGYGADRDEEQRIYEAEHDDEMNNLMGRIKHEHNQAN